MSTTVYTVYMAINAVLKKLGFTDKEVTVYLALFKRGKMTPTQLAKATKINRATVYTITDSLQAKGIVTSDLSAKITSFIPLPPERLKEIVTRPMRELKEKSKLIEKAIDELSIIVSAQEYPVPKIRFIEESGLENFLYENIPRWLKSVRSVDSTWWGIQDYTLLEHYKDFIDWYWSSQLSENINMYLIGNESPEEQRMLKDVQKKTRDVRISNDMLFTSSVWVGGDYLIMIVTRQHPFYLVEIHDVTLAHNMREVFKKLWQEYKPNLER